MHVGMQIEAPCGWGPMPQGVVFHFLRSDAKRGRVLLVYFEVRETRKSCRAHILAIPRNKFEDGLDKTKIIPLSKQSTLPPWLAELEGIDLSLRDSGRSQPKVLHSWRVEERFMHIASTVRDFDNVLAADNLERELNRRAKLCLPPQNETRFRLHVLTYMCFGKNIWALLPPFHHIGKWDRYEHPNTKLGRSSSAYGRCYGNGSSKELTDRCVKSYLKRAELGKHRTTIYHEAMIDDFGCQVITVRQGMKVYLQPEGKPFPTYWQFLYRITKVIGIEEIQKKLYGSARYRSKCAPTKGAFSEEVANLLERIEADGYYTQELPRGYLQGSSLPPLCVVTGRDVLSGLKLGIGFSFGAERSTAYRMMLFCMAVPKVYFCSLFGIAISPGEWPNEGLSGHLGIDRGPGARRDLVKEAERKFPIKDMAPSYSGQSKATIESSHPRSMRLEGQPTYLKSEFTPIQLAKREIMRLLKYNTCANMEGRFEPDSDLAFVPPTPLGLWNYYDQRFRNDAMPISIAEAVRTFLTPMEFSLKDDGVWLDQRKFTSDELVASGILDGVARSGRTGAKISGYVLDMCIRHIWIEFKGRILQLEATLRIRGDDATLWMSLSELEQWQTARQATRAAFDIHQHAASSEFHQRFKESTGKEWNAAERRAGKPKRDASARQEEYEASQATSARRAA